MRRIFALLGALVMAAALLAGCGGKSGGASASAGSASASAGAGEDSGEKVIHIGCEATTPSWMQADDKGGLSGYDYDVWTEIGKRIGYQIDIQVMDWDGMWVMLDDGRLDTVAEQISVNEERQKKYDFTEPYAYNVYSLLAAADNAGLKTMSDLKDGMTISCETNTSDEIIVSAIEKQYGVTLERTYYDGMSVLDVALGRCDLWPRAKTSCQQTVKEVENLKILGDTDCIETNAYPFLKTQRGEKLAKLASGAIEEMRKDGTLTKLSQKWFGMDISENIYSK
jgi:ABC-type amino acid transport substrate-binding protein